MPYVARVIGRYEWRGVATENEFHYRQSWCGRGDPAFARTGLPKVSTTTKFDLKVEPPGMELTMEVKDRGNG